MIEAHYTITGAQDWPMFKEMLAGMRILFMILWATIGGLIAAMWRNLGSRISNQRSEDKSNCDKCQMRQTREFVDLWDAIDIAAPRSPEVQAIVKAGKSRHAPKEAPA